MPFVRLDDQWLENPKVAQAGTLAAHLYSAGITYANRHLTDGYVPAGILNRLCDWTDVTHAGEPVTNQQLAERLVENGLWYRVDGGFEIHDYFQFQPSRAEVEAKRGAISAARKQAGSKGGSKRQANPVAKPKQNESTAEANHKPQTQTQTQTPTTELHIRDTRSKPSTAAGRKAQRTKARLAIASVPDLDGAA